MTATLNGIAIQTAEIHEPRTGIWFADVDLDADEAPTGLVTMDIDGVQFVGTVRRGDVDNGRVRLRVFGGADGLKDETPSKFYRDATVKTLLKDLCRESGETQATDIDSSVLTTTFAKWSRSAGTGRQALEQLTEDASVDWRIQRDGALWLGTDTYPEPKVPGVEIETDHREGSLFYAPDEGALVAPGTTFQGRKVGKVVTYVRPTGTRQTVWYEDAGGTGDKLVAALKRIVMNLVGKRLDYSALYPSTVVAQAPNGNVEIKCDDARIGGTGFTAIPIKHGVPGLTVNVRRGSRVLLGFEAQDPKRPYVALWESADVASLKFNGDLIEVRNGGRPVARVGDQVTVFYPPLVTFTGILGPPTPGTPISGTMAIVSSGSGIIASGNDKHLSG